VASESPKRLAADEWDNEFGYGSEGEDAIERDPLRLSSKGRSPSPKRRIGAADATRGKVVTQQYIHQYMPVVSGRATPPPRQTGERRSEEIALTQTEVISSQEGTTTTEADTARMQLEADGSEGYRFVKVSDGQDTGVLLSEWMTVLRGTPTDVAANGHCGWLAFYAALHSVMEGQLQPSGEVASKVNELKKQIINGMIANLADETRLHPRELPVELAATGSKLPLLATQAEQVCALANHYAAQRDKSVESGVPMHFWVRPSHIKAMAMHARETVYVLDVQESGCAWMQAYAYQDLPPDEVDSVETGTVCPIPTVQALHLLADLVKEGIRPPVLVLRWNPTENHFQAVTYDDTVSMLTIRTNWFN
jgi:hypothetical protein